MKIVDVCGFYSEGGGGVRSYVLQKLDAASAAGHRLTIIAPGAEDRVDRVRGGKIVWVESPPMPMDPNYRRFRGQKAVWAVLDEEAPDVVEGSSPWRSGWLAAHWPGVARRALIFHQDFVAGYPYTALGGLMPLARIDGLFAPYWSHVRRLSAQFDVTVTGGEWLARRLAGFGVQNAQAVPFGIESGRFSRGVRDEDLRRELLAASGATPSGRLLLNVGRFHPEKRHRTIVEAFALAREIQPDLGLILVGEGFGREAIEKLARLKGRVHFTGPIGDRDELARVYASADVLVHGSGAETYGLVVAEAMASGLPIVVPDAGGAADLARRGVSRLYPLGDARGCAEAILEVLALGRSDAEDDIAPASAEAHFAALFRLYDDLIASDNDARAPHRGFRRDRSSSLAVG